MSNFDQKRNKKVFEIIVMLKIIYIVLSLIPLSSLLKLKNDIKSILLITGLLSIILMTLLAYFSWMVAYIKERIDKSPQILDYLETTIMIFLFFIVLITTGLQDSGYKLLSIFIVLIGSMQFGRNYSLGVATISTIIVLLIDFLSITNNKLFLSQYLEKDLVLFSALFVTAFILGMYVDIERAHSKELKTLTT